MATVAEVIARHRAQLLALPGVIGVGEGEADGSPCIVVFVASDQQPPPSLPAVIDGYLVVVRRTARFRPQPGN